MPERTGFIHNAPVQDQVDDLKKGTFQKYDSEWTMIVSETSASFQHGLEEVPCVVDVIRAETIDGAYAKQADSGVTGGEELTIAKTDTEITITNNITTAINATSTFNGKDFFFKVRAF